LTGLALFSPVAVPDRTREFTPSTARDRIPVIQRNPVPRAIAVSISVDSNVG
jgi:hypothetical protein